MKYYKIINGNVFIGVITQMDFLRYQAKHLLLIACDESEAEYARSGDELYHADWMAPVVTASLPYTTADIISIPEDEYRALYAAVEAGEDILANAAELEPIQEPPLPIDPAEEVTLEYIRKSKIAEMSAECQKTITGGFDIVLSDGESHHFSLTVQDQLNLITLSAMAETGETAIPYHADGELCKEYSTEDISAIIDTANAFKVYQLTYYNALKSYIGGMDDIGEISEVGYGVEIPEEYMTEVLKKVRKRWRGMV